MRNSACLLLILGSTLSATASAAPVAVVNGTGARLSSLEIRPVGKGWAPLSPGLSPGARTITEIADECAFDVRGQVAGGAAISWNRLNLCEVRSVTLNRRADGMNWADYD